jgi:hypothetical protein
MVHGPGSLFLLIVLHNRHPDDTESWSQSYDVIYNASAVKIYNATGILARFENTNILFYFEKLSGLLQRRRGSCKFESRRIGS